MSRGRSDFKRACFFLAPNFIGFLIFVAFPVIFSITMAFTNWDLSLHNRYRPDQSVLWVFLRNFTDLLADADFWKYLWNTLFLMMIIPFGIVGSLLLALLLTRRLRSKRKGVRLLLAAAGLASFALLGLWLYGTGYGPISLFFCLLAGGILALGFLTGPTVYRTLFYLPSFTAGVAVFLLWKQMYNPLRGPINQVLTPVLTAVAGCVNNTSPHLWTGIACVLWAAAAVGLIWLGFLALRNCIGRDISVGMALLTLLSLGIGALILYGLGLVAHKLPNLAANGLEPPQWLTDVNWAKPAIMIMGLWLAVGSNNMLLYIAGISNIPPQLYEAADIDGASPWQRFWHVTWPQLAPTTFFIVIMSVIGGVQGGFEQARTMTQGGPYGATTTLSYYVYLQGFETLRVGYASAIAWAIFLMIFGLTLVNYRFGTRYVND